MNNFNKCNWVSKKLHLRFKSLKGFRRNRHVGFHRSSSLSNHVKTHGTLAWGIENTTLKKVAGHFPFLTTVVGPKQNHHQQKEGGFRCLHAVFLHPTPGPIGPQPMGRDPVLGRLGITGLECCGLSYSASPHRNPPAGVSPPPHYGHTKTRPTLSVIGQVACNSTGRFRTFPRCEHIDRHG